MPDQDFIGLETASERESDSTAIADYAIAVEVFTEDEIEEHLSKLLVAYRAFYLEPDEAEPRGSTDAVSARRSRYIFKAIFKNHLNSAEDEGYLLQEEEEDVLDMFMTWLRAMQAQPAVRGELFEDLSECLERVGELANAPFVKKIV